MTLRTMFRSLTRRGRVAAPILCAFLCACPGDDPDAGAPEDAGSDDDLTCDVLCAIEDSCDLRAEAACVSESCDGEERIPSTSDECMAVADDCAEVALCTCGEACEKRETCTQSPDPECVTSCETLMEQDPTATFGEIRCVIESDCADLALCSG
jgi:hypothetical protein